MLSYREDLSSYQYGMTFIIHEVKNIGWIDRHHEFKTGAIQSSFLEKLKELVFNSYKGPCKILVNELRGSYECPVCEKNNLRISTENDHFILGSAELWIPDNKEEGHYFATFGLIIHYIEDHHYTPPKEFIDAVLALDKDSIFNGQDVQDRLVRKCAGRE